MFNRCHQRIGPLFQGRFHAVAVELDSHAWELSRYVHLNPVRARKTDDPGQYAWCSFRYYLDPRHAPVWLDWHTILAEFGSTQAAGRLAYRRFVSEGLRQPPPNPLANATAGLVLGSEELVCRMLYDEEGRPPGRSLPSQVRKHLPRRSADEIVRTVAGVFGVQQCEVLQRGRHANVAREAAILLCREFVDEPLDAIGRRFGGISRSAVTDIVRRCREREENSASFRTLVASIREQLRG